MVRNLFSGTLRSLAGPLERLVRTPIEPLDHTGGHGHGPYDVVLSSGFLAFAHHSGFLQAVEDVSETKRRDVDEALVDFAAHLPFYRFNQLSSCACRLDCKLRV